MDDWICLCLVELRGTRRKQVLQQKILHRVKFDTPILRSEVEGMPYCATGDLFDKAIHYVIYMDRHVEKKVNSVLS